MSAYIVDADPKLCHTQLICEDVYECLVSNPLESSCKHSEYVGEHVFCQHPDRSEFSTLKMPRNIGPAEIMVKNGKGAFGVVKTEELDELIAYGEITAFKRTDEWIDVSIGPLRGKGSTSLFTGLERRRLFHY